jgi:hypothetical protein
VSSAFIDFQVQTALVEPGLLHHASERANVLYRLAVFVLASNLARANC